MDEARELALVEELRSRFSEDDADPEDPHDHFSTATLTRFLRARAHDVDSACEMLSKCIEWRRSYRPYDVDRSSIDDQLSRGTLMLGGKTRNGLPAIVCYPRCHNPSTSDPDEILRMAVYFLEGTIRKMKPPVSKFCFLVQFEGFALRNVDYTSIKKVLEILQGFYPERLGAALLVDAPWITWTVYKVLKPWLNERTQEKIKFLKDPKELLEVFDEENLLKDFGGRLESTLPPDYAAEQHTGTGDDDESDEGEEILLAEDEEDDVLTEDDVRAFGASRRPSMAALSKSVTAHIPHESDTATDIESPLTVEVASGVLPVTLEAFYYLFFSSDSTFMEKFGRVVGIEDLSVTEWQQNPKDGGEIRKCEYRIPEKGVAVTEMQQCALYRQSELIVIEMTTTRRKQSDADSYTQSLIRMHVQADPGNTKVTMTVSGNFVSHQLSENDADKNEQPQSETKTFFEKWLAHAERHVEQARAAMNPKLRKSRDLSREASSKATKASKGADEAVRESAGTQVREKSAMSSTAGEQAGGQRGAVSRIGAQQSFGSAQARGGASSWFDTKAGIACTVTLVVCLLYGAYCLGSVIGSVDQMQSSIEKLDATQSIYLNAVNTRLDDGLGRVVSSGQWAALRRLALDARLAVRHAESRLNALEAMLGELEESVEPAEAAGGSEAEERVEVSKKEAKAARAQEEL